MLNSKSNVILYLCSKIVIQYTFLRKFRKVIYYYIHPLLDHIRTLKYLGEIETSKICIVAEDGEDRNLKTGEKASASFLVMFTSFTSRCIKYI